MTKFNVIMVVLDGLRNDRIHLCPTLVDVLNKSYFFSNTITAAPYTLASLHSVITGLYPQKHGVNSYFNMFKFKKDICKTLTSYLKDYGYYTEANLADDSIIPSKDFDTFKAHDEYNDDVTRLHKDIITKLSDKKFFLFLHRNNLHTRTVKQVGRKYTDFDKEFFNNYERNKDNYNLWLKETDLYVKEIYTHIEKLSLLKNTILVFLSDHGMSNGEKVGEKMYGTFTYNYTIKVFCSIILPNIKGNEITYQTRTIDIMPTVLDILNIKVDESYEHLQGKSLVLFMEGKEKGDRIAFSETGGLNGPWPSPRKNNVFCIIEKNWKLIYNKTPNSWELYNLEQDPKEEKNVFDNNKNEEHTLNLQKILIGHIDSNEEEIYS